MAEPKATEPWFAEEHAQAVRDLATVYLEHFDAVFARMIADWASSTQAHVTDSEVATRREDGREALTRAFAGDWEHYEAYLRTRGRLYASRGIPFRTWFRLSDAVDATVPPILIRRFAAHDAERLEKAFRAYRMFMDRTLGTIGEEHIRATEERAAVVARGTFDAIITRDDAGIITDFNAAAEKMFGYLAADVIGKPLATLVPAWKLGADPQGMGVVAGAMIAEGRSMVVTGRRADQSEFQAEVVVVSISTGGPLRFTGFLRDLTASQRASEELRAQKDQALETARELAVSQELLRALAGRMQEVREQESRRISRDVHDVFGQALTALKLDLVWLARRVTEGRDEPADSSSMAERCGAMLELIDKTLASARQIASDLRPGVLDDLGIEAAIDWQTRDFTRRTGIPVELALPEERAEIGAEQATALFRIAQEALTNVTRHAQATQVVVRVAIGATETTLEISDNGVGLRERGVASRNALGLMGMRERAALLGGTVEVSGRSGAGTTVVARLPLRGKSASEVPRA